jgi:hypothetical protein
VDEVVPIVAPRASRLAVKEMLAGAETALLSVTVAVGEVELIETEPEVEVMLALDSEVVVISPDPARVMFPEAWSAPVGATEVPSVIERSPEVAVRDPPPEYVPVGRMLIVDAEVALTMVMFRPETVSGPLELKAPAVLDTSPGAEKVTAPPAKVEIARSPKARCVLAAVF